MILYYDNYIIDQPLIKSTIISISDLRKSDTPYKQTSKLSVAKYTLASYKVFPWSDVIIKVDAEKKEDKDEFIRYAREIFPDAEIIPQRSDSQKKYKETVEKILKMDDEWTFFIPNNDHPIIASDISIIYRLLEKAEKFKKQYKYVSIIFSMYTEYYNTRNAFKDVIVIDEDDDSYSMLCPNGNYNSCQIVDKNILKQWYFSKDLGDIMIRRVEDLEKYIVTKDQITLIPKKEICAHFDGYSHTRWYPFQISEDKIPPLFIPPGFFENNIRIAYGYDDYRDGWVNVNPSKSKYSFRSKKSGTDLKICLNDLPLFWKGKIGKIDFNSKSNPDIMKRGRDKYYETLENPWKSYWYRLYIKIKSDIYWNIRKINK